MTYTCAYYADPLETLETAQRRKLDYVCRKLRLRPGERLLDMGCGWGALTVHAARHYGVEVTAITLSEQQAAYTRERVAAAGLGDRCRVELVDFRDLDGRTVYDKIAAIGIVEHVGRSLLATYFRLAWRLLRPHGVFLSHGQTRSLMHYKGSRFIDAYVFPDGELVTVSDTLRAAEAAGFEVRDVENLREHYAITVRSWRERLESHASEVRALVGEERYRIYRMYLAGIGFAHQRGRINLHQVLLSKSCDGAADLPLTRGDWYTR